MAILQLGLQLPTCSPSSLRQNPPASCQLPSTHFQFRLNSYSHHLTTKHSQFLYSNPSVNFRNYSRICSSAANSTQVEESDGVVKDKSVSVILLAGGKGKRMRVNTPKQYLPILGKPIALYSFYKFAEMREVKEIIVVCDAEYADLFIGTLETINVDLKLAYPGKERQDSVYNGLQAIDSDSELVCIHDSARPLVSSEDISKVLKDGLRIGASVLGVPAKATIKEANSESFVVKTLERKTLWEMQTPQVIKPELLKKGFELVKSEGLEVTDDVSIVEYLKHPVYITQGSYTNIKVTTPDDLVFAEWIIKNASEESS